MLDYDASPDLTIFLCLFAFITFIRKFLNSKEKSPKINSLIKFNQNKEDIEDNNAPRNTKDKPFENLSETSINNFQKKEDRETSKLIEEIEKLKKKLKEHSLLFENNAIISQIQNIRITNLEKDNKLIMNSYKLLFYRKASNSLLEKIFEKKADFKKTPCLFKDESKPPEKSTIFPIIIAVEPKDNKIKRNEKNLAIDYLMFLRDNVSSTIHISDKTSLYQIEFLFNYLNKKDVNIEAIDCEKITINTSEMLSLLFDNNLKNTNNDINENLIEEAGTAENFKYKEIDPYFDISKDEEKVSKIIEDNTKILLNLNVNNFSKFKSQISVNSELIFSRWKKSFSCLSYKKNKHFKNLVVFDEKMSMERMSNIIKEMIGDQDFEVFKQDAKNFSGMVRPLNEEELSKYYNN